MGTYQTNELNTLTAQPIIDRLLKTLEDLNRTVYTNYMQNVEISSDEPHEYTLNYIPIENSLFILINGVAYSNEYDYFSYDADSNSIKWNDDYLVLEEDFSFIIIYNFDLSVNGLSRIEDVVY